MFAAWKNHSETICLQVFAVLSAPLLLKITSFHLFEQVIYSLLFFLIPAL